jgi:hypothetical protein
VTPRYVPNDEFSLSVQYRYRSKGADSYSGTFQTNSADGTPLSLDAATLGEATEQTEQRLGFAVTYSTVRGYTRRTARWPLELSFMHTPGDERKGRAADVDERDRLQDLPADSWKLASRRTVRWRPWVQVKCLNGVL